MKTTSSAGETATLTDEQFQAIARALADPRRFAMLQQIASGGCIGCGSLQEHAVLSPATISHHIKELSEAGLIQIEREGRTSNLSLIRPVLNAYLKRLSSL